MVVINEIAEPISELFHPDGTKIGTITSNLQVNDICIQIMKQKLEGYYFMFEGKKVVIENDGRIYNAPFGFYNKHSEQLRELLGF